MVHDSAVAAQTGTTIYNASFRQRVLCRSCPTLVYVKSIPEILQDTPIDCAESSSKLKISVHGYRYLS